MSKYVFLDLNLGNTSYKSNVFFRANKSRSSSVYQGLIEIRSSSSSNTFFQIFQIPQIVKWKWKWKWKDPTCAIFLKNMGLKDIKYDFPVCQK